MSVRPNILLSIVLGLMMLNQIVGSDRNPNYNCSHLNFQCDPTDPHSCCNEINICRNISKNVFRCVLNEKELGEICETDAQCDHILHAKCSSDKKICICRANNIQAKKKCLPLLDSFCWKNEECAANNSACIDNKCTCNASYVQNSLGECMLNVLGQSCSNDTWCSKTKFATCSENKICTCSPNTVEIDGIRCSPVLNGSCSQDDDCFPSFSECINNKCQCKSGFAPESVKECVPGHLGAHCRTNYQCNHGVNHSYCSQQQKKCVCKNKYFPSKGKCNPEINVSCSDTDICSIKESICLNNVCQCKPEYQYENYQCFPTQLETPCDNNKDCIKIKHSVCSIDNSCVCEDNYVKVNKATCEPLILGFFFKNESCIISHSIEIDDKCQCAPGYFPKLNNTVCVLLLGSNCSTDEQCWPNRSVCIDNICECNFTTIEISNDKCAVPLGFECSMDQDCRDIANGHCSNDHTCDCQENYGQLNETACKPILGGPCLIDGDCIVDNSHCLYKKCQCKPNFLSILNEKCVALNLNQPCNDDNDCYGVPNSKCSPDNKCVCLPYYKAFGDTKCLSLLGENCFYDNNCFSHESVCINNKCRCPVKMRALSSKDQCVTVQLGIPCEVYEDCVAITNAQCSKDKICACKSNHFALNINSCAPSLNEICLENDDCMVNSSICVNNRCECQPGFSPVSHNKCESNLLLFACEKDSDCGDPWHSKCSKEKTCICNINNQAVDKSTCLPLKNGYCWVNHQCFVEHSSCVDFHCQCNNNFVAVSINLCVAINATLFT